MRSVFFPFFFLENDLSKGLKILGLMFFKANGMSSVEEAFLWTQRFLARKNLPKNRSLFMRNETKSKCLPKFYVSSKQDKEYYRKTTPYLEQPSRHVSSSFMRRKRLKPLTVPLETKKKNNNYSFQSRWIVALGIFTSISKNNCQFPDLISLLLLSRLLLSVSFIYIYIYIYNYK